jgi:hypothetical protein
MEPRRLLFVMWDGGGNVPPQLGLARKLVARGHQVHVLTEPSLRQDVLAAGASYTSFTKAPHRQDRSRQSDLVRDFDARTPPGALAAIRDRVIFGPARAYAQDTMAELQRVRPHVLAVDWCLAGAAVAGEAAGVPTALLMHANNPVPEPGKPPPGFGFLPARSALGRARDRAFTRVFRRLFGKGLPALNDARVALGLQPLGHVLEQLQRPARFLCLYSEAFDLPADRHPQQLRYVGPVLEQPAWAEPWSPPWPPDDQRPLVGGQHEHHLHAAGAGPAALHPGRLLDAGAGLGHRRTHAGSRRLPRQPERGRGGLGTTRAGVPARQCRRHPRRHGHRHARAGSRPPAPVHAAGPRPARRHRPGSLAWRWPAPPAARVRGQDPSSAGPRATPAVIPGSSRTAPAGDPGRP